MISFRQYGGKGNPVNLSEVAKYYTAEKEYSPEFKAILEAEAKAQGVSHYYAAGGDHDRDKMVWDGDGCKAWGLRAGTAATAKEIEAVMGGYHATTGKAQAQNAGDPERRAAWDFTFSASKGFSMLKAGSQGEEKEALQAAYDGAVIKASNWLLSQATTRKGAGGQDKEQAGGFVVGRKTEATNRNGEANDHTHCVAMNAGIDSDGDACTIDNQQLLRSRMAADALFQADIRYQTAQLGYANTYERAKNSHDNPTNAAHHGIAGIGREDERVCSSRQQEMDELIAAKAKDGVKLSRQEACLRTRQGKEERPWREACAEAEADMQAKGVLPDSASLKGLESQSQGKPETTQELIALMHEHDAVMTRDKIVYTIATHWGEKLGMQGTLDTADAWERDGLMQTRGVDRNGETLYCSTSYLQAEKEFRQSCLDRKDDPTARMEPARAEAAIAAHERSQSERLGKSFVLDDEQNAAVKSVLCETGGTSILNGKPGAGKTATVGACVKAWQSEGRDVIGLTVGQKAASVLENDIQQPCFNLTKFFAMVDSGEHIPKPGTVYLVDESGMGGMEHIARLQKLADMPDENGRRGRVVLSGDLDQLAAVSAGSAHIAAAEMIGMTNAGSIKRQKDPGQLQLANMLSSPEDKHSGQEIADFMHKTGRLQTAGKGQDTAPACAEIAKQWMAGEYKDEHGESKVALAETRLVIAATHKDRNQVNTLIQQARADAGDTQPLNDKHGQPMAFPMLAREDKSGRGSKHAERLQEVRIGERIAFTKNNDTQKKGVSQGEAINSETGTVIGYRDYFMGENGKKINEPTLLVQMDKQGAGVVEFQPRINKAWDLGYAGTTHFAQGMTVNRSWEVAPEARGEMRNAALVNNTRARFQHTVIGPEERTDAYATVAGEFHRKANAMSFEEVQAMTPSPPTLSQRLGAEVARVSGQWQDQARKREHARAEEQPPRQSWSMER